MTPVRKSARRLIPRRVRQRLYELRPGREARWSKFPGVQTVDAAGRVALTFDDGPDPDCTPAMVRALDLADARATFFLTGEQVAEHPDVLLHLVDAGHEIGVHGFGHLRLDRVSTLASAQDVRRGLEEIQRVADIPIRWFRPPYGRMSSGSDLACRELGLTPVYWSAWGHDWEPITAHEIVTIATPLLVDGAVLLLHDSARYAPRRTADATVAAVPMLARVADGLNLKLVALGDTL